MAPRLRVETGYGQSRTRTRPTVWQVQDDIVQRGGALPFWMDASLSFSTVLFVAGLAVLAAMIAGGKPGESLNAARHRVILRGRQAKGASLVYDAYKAEKEC